MASRSKRRKAREAEQLLLPKVSLFTHGGRRPGAGRPPKEGRRRVAHGVREDINPRHPVQITWRCLEGIPSLRDPKLARLFLEVIERTRNESFHIAHFGLQDDHVHVTIEATSRKAMIKGMTGVKSLFARKINKAIGRRGKVWDGRYHSRVLRTPTEVHNSLTYVLMNAKKHGTLDGDRIDSYSSIGQLALHGGLDVELVHPDDAWILARKLPLAPPRTWLLQVGWYTRSGCGRLGPNRSPRPY